ncbi:MAG: hypothetical protein Q4G42_04705 [Neisseria sp.]|nr:hypothetical protein [Neisseria sp.]
MSAEKIYYGLLALVIAFSVLASPFFYARSMRFLHQRWQDQQFKQKIKEEQYPPKQDDESA